MIVEHEDAILERAIPNDDIEGISVASLKVFVRHRVNLCLQQLGLSPLFDESNNTIKDWFYQGINSVQLHDFFVGVGNEYNRDWSEKKFSWGVNK
jgi:ribonucleotide reductase beta subunit family protein with ferritin-like domain